MRKPADVVPLKFCSHGQHLKPASQFRRSTGTHKRPICLDCYGKIRAAEQAKKGN